MRARISGNKLASSDASFTRLGNHCSGVSITLKIRHRDLYRLHE